MDFNTLILVLCLKLVPPKSRVTFLSVLSEVVSVGLYPRYATL